MIRLTHLLTEQTDAVKFCKKNILSKPQFSKEKWSAIGVWPPKGGRNVAGTSVPSQHNIGNAIDWHGAKGVGDPVMQELADYLVANHSVYSAKNVIYNRRIWNSPKGWHVYKGEDPHTNHVHIDFKTTAKLKNNNVQKNNDIVQQALWDMYNKTTKNPEKYFKQYKGQWWIPGDDKPEAAAKKLKSLFFNTWYDRLLKIYSFGTAEDKKNINWLTKAVNDVAKLIETGQSGQVPVKFLKWNAQNQTYKLIKQKFNWTYM